MGFRFFLLLWGWPGFPKWLPHRQQPPPNFFTMQRTTAGNERGLGTTTEYEQNDENLYASRYRRGSWWCLHFITRSEAAEHAAAHKIHVRVHVSAQENSSTLIAVHDHCEVGREQNCYSVKNKFSKLEPEQIPELGLSSYTLLLGSPLEFTVGSDTGPDCAEQRTFDHQARSQRYQSTSSLDFDAVLGSFEAHLQELYRVVRCITNHAGIFVRIYDLQLS